MHFIASSSSRNSHLFRKSSVRAVLFRHTSTSSLSRRQSQVNTTRSSRRMVVELIHDRVDQHRLVVNREHAVCRYRDPVVTLECERLAGHEHDVRAAIPALHLVLAAADLRFAVGCV